VYEAFFVPALFQRWATRLIAAAAIRPSSESSMWLAARVCLPAALLIA
jgi:hypothetical protein